MTSKRATSLMTIWVVALLTAVFGWFSLAQGGTPTAQSRAQSTAQNVAQNNLPVPAGMTRAPNGAPIPSLLPPAPQLPPGLKLPPNAPNPFAPPPGVSQTTPQGLLHPGSLACHYGEPHTPSREEVERNTTWAGMIAHIISQYKAAGAAKAMPVDHTVTLAVTSEVPRSSSHLSRPGSVRSRTEL